MICGRFRSCGRLLKSTELFYQRTTRFLSKAESKTTGVLKTGENGKELSKEEWKKRLTPLQYCICRESDTERPFSGAFVDHFQPGSYTCTCCGTELFESETKFKSGCGWPSFFAAKSEDVIIRKQDTSYNMIRVEVLCAKCNAHLGHVFDDGPKPTGERFCINSMSLNFKPKSNS